MHKKFLILILLSFDHVSANVIMNKIVNRLLSMSIENQIELKINSELTPQLLEIENESHKHSGNSNTSHFRLVIVASAFDGLRLIARHRKVNAILAQELANEIHALALHTFTPQEWQDRGQSSTKSPACAGG